MVLIVSPPALANPKSTVQWSNTVSRSGKQSKIQRRCSIPDWEEKGILDDSGDSEHQKNTLENCYDQDLLKN